MNQVFEQTKRKHEDLLIISENKEEGLADAATSFLIEISKAGAQVANRHMRAQLRAILRFWEDYVYNETGEMPIVRLEPALGPDLLKQAGAALEAGDLTEALDLLRQAHELQPEDPEIATRYAGLQRRRTLEE